VTEATIPRIELLHVKDCPNVGQVRETLQLALLQAGLRTPITEIEGAFSSPTLLIDGVDVTGRQAEHQPSCRLDLPTVAQILAALAVALTRGSRSKES
jgi:hypothetical protein